jgi:pilus assembly protein Flp/PilA
MEEERRRGQAMVEYALILVLIAVVVIGVLLILGGQIKSIFTSISGALAGH